MTRRPDEELPLSPQKPVREDVDRELAAHLELRTEELVAQGMTPDAARAEARRQFGDLGSVAAECREITVRSRRLQRRSELLGGLRHDLLHGARVLRKNPGFTLTAALTLAIGIGAATAIFSVVNGVLLRPLPYDSPEQLVDVAELHQKGFSDIPWTNFLDLEARARSFDGMAQYGGGRSTVVGGDEPQRVVVARVSRDFFHVLRTRAWMGRLPSADDHALGAAPVAVVSYRFWRNHMGATADLHSARLRGEQAWDVIGVLPPDFDFPAGSDIWRPLELDAQPASRTAHNYDTVARLRRGVSVSVATRELDALYAGIKAEAGVDFDATGAQVSPLQELLTGPVRQPLFLLLGASALLLIAASTNLASNLLARGTARSGELAIRAALGAGRLRIIRQVFTESLLIAALGCALGLGLAMALVRVLLAVAPSGLVRPGDARLDPWVLSFTIGLGLMTSVLFGLFPAMRIADVDANSVIREGQRGGTGPGRQRVWAALVGVEVALALILLVGSGLMLRSFAQVLGVNLGFDPAGVMTVTTDLPEHTYADVTQAVAYHDRLLEALRHIPGVSAAGATNMLPLDGEFPSGGIQVEGRPLLPVGFPITGFAVYRIVTPGYFDAMGMHVVQGRGIAETDVAGAANVVVVNQALAKEGWPGANPIGGRMRIGGMDGPNVEPWATVVGVVQNVPGGGVTQPARAAYYYAVKQLPHRARRLRTVVRTSLPPASLIPQIRAALRDIDPEVPGEFQSLDDHVRASIADRRFMMLVLATFAVAALALAAVGIYGVVSYAVAQRTREIGIRIALGAQARDVIRMVQGRSMTMVGAGVLAGIAGALALTRLMRSLLYAISPGDPLTFVTVTLVLVASGFVASWLPAWRGTRVDPLTAIRSE